MTLIKALPKTKSLVHAEVLLDLQGIETSTRTSVVTSRVVKLQFQAILSTLC